jgi:hypothetical protein
MSRIDELMSAEGLTELEALALMYRKAKRHAHVHGDIADIAELLVWLVEFTDGTRLDELDKGALAEIGPGPMRRR